MTRHRVEEFIEVWQSAANREEVMQRLGMTAEDIRRRLWWYKRKGIVLQDLPALIRKDFTGCMKKRRARKKPPTVIRWLYIFRWCGRIVHMALLEKQATDPPCDVNWDEGWEIPVVRKRGILPDERTRRLSPVAEWLADVVSGEL